MAQYIFSGHLTVKSTTTQVQLWGITIIDAIMANLPGSVDNSLYNLQELIKCSTKIVEH